MRKKILLPGLFYAVLAVAVFGATAVLYLLISPRYADALDRWFIARFGV
jgi:hypothetical protein